FTIQNNAVHLTSFNSLNQRTIELEKVLLEWKSKRLFRCLDGWRNERYFIYGPNGPLLEIERAATGLFGVLSLGCQLNGYTIVNNEIKMWIGKRSLSKQTYPGMLDNTVGGGLTAGSIPLQTLIKECYEEAGIEEHLASKSKYVGYISYWQEKEFESNSGIDYIFDLQLPESFIPKPVDLEVDSFQLVSMTDLKELILQNKFHPEALMVVVDFLIRHHAIS
ncbi:NUDIX hydrolase domain-like protein, partial [Globomyces pollinis-pini]